MKEDEKMVVGERFVFVPHLVIVPSKPPKFDKNDKGIKRRIFLYEDKENKE